MPDRDPVRLLHRRSEHAYTDRLDQSMFDEPEAVDEMTQAHLSEEARARRHRQQANAWKLARTTIIDAITGFTADAGRLDPPVISAVRATLRAADGVGRKLGV